MTKGIGEFILAGLAAPGLGLFASWFGLDRLSKHNDVPVAEMADYCARLDPALVGAGCESVELLTLLQQLSIAALAATIAVPLLYWLCALVLGRSLLSYGPSAVDEALRHGESLIVSQGFRAEAEGRAAG